MSNRPSTADFRGARPEFRLRAVLFAIASASIAPAIAGDARGAEPTQYFSLQTTFSAQDAEKGNSVELTWTETQAIAGGVKILIDGSQVATQPGLPAGSLPGQNRITLPNLAAGDHVFEAIAGAQSLGGEVLRVIDNQLQVVGDPQADPVQAACQQNNGTLCAIDGSWTNPGPIPTIYQVYLDGAFQLEIDGFLGTTSIPVTTQGQHCIQIVGIFVATPDSFGYSGRYRTQPFEACCPTTCGLSTCAPPRNLAVCQTAYGSGADACVLGALWVNGETSYPNGVRVFFDGTSLGTLGTTARGVEVNNFGPGRHTLGVQGSCGGTQGDSAIVELAMDFLAQSPLTHPIDGVPACVWSADGGGKTTVTWTIGVPAISIDVYVETSVKTTFVGSVSGDHTSITVTHTAKSDAILLQFFDIVGEGCYGSEIIRCSVTGGPTNRFIRGVCTDDPSPASDRPDISNAVFSLSHLFLGGNQPACAEACDVDADGSYNITDPVILLNFLFLGSAPPKGWIDQDGQGGPDPTCESAPVERCATGHPKCAAP